MRQVYDHCFYSTEKFDYKSKGLTWIKGAGKIDYGKKWIPASDYMETNINNRRKIEEVD